MAIGLIACKEKVENNLEVQVYEEPVFVEPDVYEFGFNLNDYVVKRDTIRRGDSFGTI